MVNNIISDEDNGYQTTTAVNPPDLFHFQTKKIKKSNETLTILLQNSNGPCALLAIVNSLILSNATIYQSLSQYVAYSDIVEVSELLKYLTEIIHNSRTLTGEEIEIVLSLLPTLNTGLSITPKFDGSFEQTKELLIFKAFGLQITHGWIISPDVDREEFQTITDRYPSYESAQQCLVDAYDISEKTTKTENELQIVEDSYKIRSFFAKCGTQLTEYGLTTLSRHLTPGQVYIFFRNDHFNTIIRDGMEIFQLLTDFGFADKSEYVWESLLSINGMNNSFFKGDFQPIFIKENSNPFATTEDSHQEQMEYEDRALAMALQEEEDQRVAKALQKRYQKSNEGQATAQSKKEKKEKAKKGKKKSRCIIL